MMPSPLDSVSSVVVAISAPDVLFKSDGLWQSVAAEAWIDKAEAAGHSIQAIDWNPRGPRVLARVGIAAGWLNLTYSLHGQTARVYPISDPSGVGEEGMYRNEATSRPLLFGSSLVGDVDVT